MPVAHSNPPRVAFNYVWNRFTLHGTKAKLVTAQVYGLSFMLAGVMLDWLGDKEATTYSKVMSCIGLVVLVGLSGFMIYENTSSNAASRVLLEKLQAMLKDSELQQAVRKVLNRSVVYPASKILTLDCSLPKQDKIDLGFVLEHMANWNMGSEIFAQMLEGPMGVVGGSRRVEYALAALMRLWFDTDVLPEQQLLRQLEEWQIDRLLHKGGFNYLAWCAESVKLSLIKFIPLLVQSAAHFSEADLEAELRHVDAGYQHELDEFNRDEVVKVSLASYSAAFLEVIGKHLAHDWWQTSSKFFMGAFSWELSGRLYSLACGQTYSYGSSAYNGFKFGYWLVTGVGAALALNVGILGSQYILSKFHKGLDVSRYYTLCRQLLFSVTIADALWQPIADVSALYEGLLHNIHPALYPVSMVIACGLYLIPSFLFKALHNWSNVVHVENSGQKKFVCSDEFVALLVLLYTSFLYSPMFFYHCTGLDFTAMTPAAILLDSLVAGIGAVWPVMIVMAIQNQVTLKNFKKGLDGVVEGHPDVVGYSLSPIEREECSSEALLTRGGVGSSASPLVRCGQWAQSAAHAAVETYFGAVRAAGACFPP